MGRGKNRSREREWNPTEEVCRISSYKGKVCKCEFIN